MHSALLLRAGSIIAIATATVLACQYSPAIKSGHESGIILKLPDKLGNLVAHSEKPSETELKLLPSDTEFAKCVYVTDSTDILQRDVVRASIVLAGSERRSIHRPEVCLPGQGWSIIASNTRTIEIQPGQSLQVRDLTIERRSESLTEKEPLRAHYIYWFVGTDKTTPSHVERTLLSTWDSIVRGVNHRWAYVSFIAAVTAGHNSAHTKERCRTEAETQNLLTYVIQNSAPLFQKSFMTK
jgi:hypothetical protein